MALGFLLEGYFVPTLLLLAVTNSSWNNELIRVVKKHQLSEQEM